MKGGGGLEPMEDIYRRYGQMVYRYLLSLTRDPDTAEELAQETFCQAIRCIGRYDGSCRISTWLCAIARNQLSAWRRKHPPQLSLEEERDTAPSAEADVLAEAERVEILRRLHASPEPYREVLYLRWFGGLSFREIGEICGRTENWARVTAYRGKERLRKELEEHE